MTIHYSIFDSLLEPVFVLNAEQKVVYCNETAATVAGLSVRKISRGMKFSEIFEFSEPIDGIEKIREVTDATPYKEVSFRALHAEEGKVQITLQPIFNSENEKNWLVFIRDVTLEERLQKKYRAELEQKEGVIHDLEEAKIQLEDYSKNLERMVAERTEELSRMNQTMSALLDSLEQGFFIFNAEGEILNVSSKACESTVECSPNGHKIWDILKISEDKTEGFKKWMQTLFLEMLPFSDLSILGPATYPHSEKRNIALEYHPLRSEAGSIEGVVVVASDITSLITAQNQAEQEKEHAKLIINLIKSKREVFRFIAEAKVLLSQIKHEVNTDNISHNSEELFRALHTLKGGAGLFSVKNLNEACHQAEGILAELRKNWNQSSLNSLREKSQLIEEYFESFLNQTNEILGSSSLAAERQIEVSISELNKITTKIKQLPGGASLAQDLLQELAMEPVENFLAPYSDFIQKMAEKNNKLIAPLKINNGSLKVMPEVYNELFATLVHAFRNSLDHGIENPNLRLSKGKREEGQLEVSFKLLQVPKGTHLQIQIVDDGNGINPETIRSKLAKAGLNHSSESDDQVIQHIFDSHFSTREIATEISGRGIGMDAIMSAATALGGMAWVKSQLGTGTSLFIEVPYLTNISEDNHKAAA